MTYERSALHGDEGGLGVRFTGAKGCIAASAPAQSQRRLGWDGRACAGA